MALSGMVLILAFLLVGIPVIVAIIAAIATVVSTAGYFSGREDEE